MVPFLCVRIQSLILVKHFCLSVDCLYTHISEWLLAIGYHIIKIFYHLLEIFYTVSQKNRATFLRPITLEILNRSLPNWEKSRSVYSEHHAIIYLNQSWKIVAPSGE